MFKSGLKSEFYNIFLIFEFTMARTKPNSNKTKSSSSFKTKRACRKSAPATGHVPSSESDSESHTLSGATSPAPSNDTLPSGVRRLSRSPDNTEIVPSKPSSRKSSVDDDKVPKVTSFYYNSWFKGNKIFPKGFKKNIKVEIDSIVLRVSEENNPAESVKLVLEGDDILTCKLSGFHMESKI